MKPIAQFNMGSQYFFSVFTDYESKDTDEICIMDTFGPKETNVLNIRKDGKDVFLYRNMSKEEFINDTLKSKVSMKVGKFLIPEFCEYLNFTIEDLRLFNDIFDNIDGMHKYEKIIYDAYLENGDFFLTDEQRLKAYEEYKKPREELKLMNGIEKTIYDSYKFLRSKTNGKIIYGGSYGLYLNGIKLDRELKHVDVKILGVSKEDELKLKNISLNCHANVLLDVEPDLEYHEVEFYHEKLLVYTIDSIIKCKKNIIEKHDNDLRYLKETYGLE